MTLIGFNNENNRLNFVLIVITRLNFIYRQHLTNRRKVKQIVTGRSITIRKMFTIKIIVINIINRTIDRSID